MKTCNIKRPRLTPLPTHGEVNRGRGGRKRRGNISTLVNLLVYFHCGVDFPYKEACSYVAHGATHQS